MHRSGIPPPSAKNASPAATALVLLRVTTTIFVESRPHSRGTTDTNAARAFDTTPPRGSGRQASPSREPDILRHSGTKP